MVRIIKVVNKEINHKFRIIILSLNELKIIINIK